MPPRPGNGSSPSGFDWRRLADAALEATIVGSYTKLGLTARRAMGPWEDLDAVSLRGRTVMVTGATSGLGEAAALRLARMGAAVRIVARSADKTAEACDRLRADSGNDDIAHYTADLGDLEAVRELVVQVRERESRLDALVHNAGLMLDERRESPQGHEVTYAVMVLAPALLTEGLVPLLDRTAAGPGSDPSRVVLVSSGGMYTQHLDVDDPESEQRYRGSLVYAKAKRAQVVLAQRWGDRWRDRGIVVHAMHPGWAATPGVTASLPGFDKVLGPLLRSPDQGADTMVWLVASDEPTRSTGKFWHDRRPRTTHILGRTKESADERAELERLVDEAIEPFRTDSAGG